MQRTAIAIALWLVTACGPSSRAPRPAYDPTSIPRAELDARPGDNMFAIIRTLRPTWLQVSVSGARMNSNAVAAPTIYLDGREFGTPDMLKSISSASVQSVKYYSLTEAQNHFGLRARTTVIDITSRK